MVELGLLTPHWPAPYGRDAGPVEQLVIDQEFAAVEVPRPNLAVGAWALPTIIAHGTQAQQERFVVPTLLGELVWCQLFSEPGAGSDLAALSTRATPVDGGWVLNGQKVWTSVAQRADFGICLARTDPDAAKHAGITYFLVDMHTPGIEVRPLREITGDALFNEVFLTDVFVPDACVVGQVNGGWRLARTTLANERVSMSSGMTFGWGIEAILGWLGGRPAHAEDPVTLDHLGALLAEAQSLAVMGQRTTLRSVSGVEPGPEASVRKLLGAEHEQRVQEFGLALLGPEGATVEGDAAMWSRGFLSTRCLTIAGGTSEVQRNVIAERLLGLPRDPEPAGQG
jgi:alkylation response protein AidB-like acyl-CoA dehydrogenase